MVVVVVAVVVGMNFAGMDCRMIAAAAAAAVVVDAAVVPRNILLLLVLQWHDIPVVEYVIIRTVQQQQGSIRTDPTKR
jgi:peptide subunit release factor RF-3